MRNIFLIVLLLLGAIGSACTEKFQELGPNPSDAFIKLHGGAFEDKGSDLLKTEDGYLLIGSTRSPSQGEKSEIYLVSTDEAGEEIWTQNIEVDTSTASGVANSMLQLADGAYLLVGTASMSNGNTNAWLVKVDANGQEEWKKTYGTSISSETGVAIEETDQGDILILGSTTNIDPIKPENNTSIDASDLYLIKVDPTNRGQLIWKKTFGYTGEDVGADIHKLKDGNFALLGTTDYPQVNDSGDKDALVILINSDGNAWNTKVIEKPNTDDTAHKIVQNMQGELLVVGSSSSLPNNNSNPQLLLLLKIDPSLNSWKELPENPISMEGYTILIQPDGRLILGGRSRNTPSRAEETKISLFELNENGVPTDSATFGQMGSNWATNMISTDEQEIVMVGTLDFGGNPMLVQIKTNENLELNP